MCQLNILKHILSAECINAITFASLQYALAAFIEFLHLADKSYSWTKDTPIQPIYHLYHTTGKKKLNHVYLCNNAGLDKLLF